MQYTLVPVSLKQAQDFENAHHRHNTAPQGHKFSIGLAKDGELIGVCTVGRPIARRLDNGTTAEITRVCVLDDYRNANSMLYGAAVRAAKAMGYTKVITYTLETESGSSLKAAGFIQDGHTPARQDYGWASSRNVKESERYPHGAKIRWLHT